MKRTMRTELLILFIALVCCSCTDSASRGTQDLERRFRAQEDSINAVLFDHFEPLSDGSSPKEISGSLKWSGLDYMLGKPTTDFPEVFSSAFTPDEIRELFPGWKHPPDVLDWMRDKKSVVLLETNIWKTIGMLEDYGGSADTLVIALDEGVITDYRFFANLMY